MKHSTNSGIKLNSNNGIKLKKKLILRNGGITNKKSMNPNLTTVNLSFR